MNRRKWMNHNWNNGPSYARNITSDFCSRHNNMPVFWQQIFQFSKAPALLLLYTSRLQFLRASMCFCEIRLWLFRQYRHWFRLNNRPHCNWCQSYHQSDTIPVRFLPGVPALHFLPVFRPRQSIPPGIINPFARRQTKFSVNQDSFASFIGCNNDNRICSIAMQILQKFWYSGFRLIISYTFSCRSVVSYKISYRVIIYPPASFQCL